MKFWRSIDPHYAPVDEKQAMQMVEEVFEDMEMSEEHYLNGLLNPLQWIEESKRGRKRRKLFDEDPIDSMETIVWKEVLRSSFIEYYHEWLQSLLPANHYPFGTTKRLNSSRETTEQKFKTELSSG